MAIESSSLDEMEVLRGMLSVPKFNDFMSPDEFEAVMIPLMTDNTNNLRQNGRIENRFNSEGYLLPQCIARFNDATYRYTYHVYRLGIRPDHVGHSLQELSSLSRSDDVQRRNMALNTLANILKIDRTGVYKRVIELPIGQIFFVLKFNLDDDTPSILIAAIRALRNLVYFPIGEICLDKMACSGMGIIQPVMSIDDAMEDDDTLDDEQLAEINLTKCLIRTGTLERIRYIVNIVKPKMEIIVNCIEILIRLARDSKFVVDKILECEGLMSSLIRYFLPTMESVGLDNSCPDWYYSPLPQMIKLLRVLSARSRNIAANLLEEYDLLNTMIPYLDEGNFFQNDTNLQVECLRYWTLVLHYEFPMDAYSQDIVVIENLLNHHLRLTNNDVSTTLITQCHVAALFMLLAKAIETGHVMFQSITTECFAKWIKQFQNMKEFESAHSHITTSILYYAAICNKYGESINYSGLLKSFLDSDGFKVATSRILDESLLMNNFETRQSTANLKALPAATWFDWQNILPVLQTNSRFAFLYAFSSFLWSDDSAMLKTEFLNHPNINYYTQRLNSCSYNDDAINWFTRCESFFIMNILKIAEKVRDEIDPALYYSTAIKCFFVFGAEQKKDIEFLVDNIIFCPRFYSPGDGMLNTKLTEIKTRNPELMFHSSEDTMNSEMIEIRTIKSPEPMFDLPEESMSTTKMTEVRTTSPELIGGLRSSRRSLGLTIMTAALCLFFVIIILYMLIVT